MKRLAVVGVLAWSHVAAAEPDRYALPNGVRVILAPDPGVAAVTIHARFDVGTDDDAAAAIVEKLAFRGSKHVTDGAYERAIEGAGGWANATVARDHTSFIDHVPTGAVALALQLEAERMFGLTIDPARVAEARRAIDQERADRAWLAALYPSRAPTDDVAAFYRAHYVPAALTLVIAGRFDPAAVKALVARDFGWMPSGTAPSRIVGTVAPTAIRISAQKIAFGAPLASPVFDAIAAILTRRGVRADYDGVDGTLVLEAADSEAIDDRLEALRTTAVSADELARTVAALELRRVEALENISVRAELIARGVGDAPVAVTAAQILEAAKIWLTRLP